MPKTTLINAPPGFSSAMGDARATIDSRGGADAGAAQGSLPKGDSARGRAPFPDQNAASAGAQHSSAAMAARLRSLLSPAETDLPGKRRSRLEEARSSELAKALLGSIRPMPGKSESPLTAVAQFRTSEMNRKHIQSERVNHDALFRTLSLPACPPPWCAPAAMVRAGRLAAYGNLVRRHKF